MILCKGKHDTAVGRAGVIRHRFGRRTLEQAIDDVAVAAGRQTDGENSHGLQGLVGNTGGVSVLGARRDRLGGHSDTAFQLYA